jgi:hypothetical protein
MDAKKVEIKKSKYVNKKCQIIIVYENSVHLCHKTMVQY